MIQSYIFLCVHSITHFSSIEHQAIRLSKWSMDFKLGAKVKKIIIIIKLQIKISLSLSIFIYIYIYIYIYPFGINKTLTKTKTQNHCFLLHFIKTKGERVRDRERSI